MRGNISTRPRVIRRDIASLSPAEMKQQRGNYEKRAARATLVSSAMKLALAGVGEGSEDGAGVLVHGLTKIHGYGEEEDQEEQVEREEENAGVRRDFPAGKGVGASR